jgi:hypothetical protein
MPLDILSVACGTPIDRCMMAFDGTNVVGICSVLGALILAFLSYRYRDGRGKTLAEQIARERQLKNET